MDTWSELAALRRKLPVDAVFACTTAAWIHGLEAKVVHPMEVIVPASSTIRTRIKLTVRRSNLAPYEVAALSGLPVTSLHRTLRDLSLFAAQVDALVAIDAALFKKLTNKARLLGDPGTAAGRRGAARFRRLIELAKPAESQMETRLRWLLRCTRVPRPEVQVDLHDGDGDFVGRADIYYRAARLVVEFDGGNHRERLVADDRRQNLLIAAGYRVLRFTRLDVYQRPEIVEGQVRAAIAA